MKEKWNVLKEKKWIWSVFAFAVPFVSSLIICAIQGVFPFGEKCILHVDMYHQYCPFFMELKEKLTNGGSLLYSWNLGLGSDFLAHYAYYLASPLNWLLVFCPKAYVIEFMTLTIWIKIGLSGMFFFLFLKERFSFAEKEIPALIFSCAYAFSGFTAAYYWDIMWMDCVALAPLVVVGLERLVKQNRPTLYYISLSVAILSNFYMGYILCVFLVLYFGLLFLEQKTQRLRITIRFAWFSLLAGGTGAVLIIPEALVLGNSASAESGWPKVVEWYFGFLEEISRLCMMAEPYTGNSHWPNLYCGVFTLLLVVLYVKNKEITWKQKLPRLCMVGFFLLSFANNYLDCFWHGFRFPNSLPARQSFLFAFVMLMIGFEAYCKQKGNRTSDIVLSLAVCIGMLVLSAWKTPEDITDFFAFWMSGIFILAYGLCLLLSRIGSKQLGQMIKGFACTLSICELLLNMGISGFYTVSRTSYLAKQEDYENLLELAKDDAVAEQILFYRVEDSERKTKNDDSLYGYASGTIFSSILNIDASHFYQSLYMEGGKNFYCYNGATPIISSMLSVKYMLSDNANGENALREKIGESNGYYLYKNTYCLPLGFMMEEEAVENWDNSQGDKIKQINELAYVLGAKELMLEKAEVFMDVSSGETKISLLEDGIYYAAYETCTSDNLTISRNDEKVTRFGKTTHRYLLELGEGEMDDVIKISNTKGEHISFTVYKLNLDAVETAYETLSDCTMVTEEYTDTYIKGSIDVTTDGRLILPITDESGWTLFVDGVETPIESFKETFISVHLEEGEHSIELSYMTPALEIGSIITLLSIGLFGLTMLIFWKKNSSKKS